MTLRGGGSIRPTPPHDSATLLAKRLTISGVDTAAAVAGLIVIVVVVVAAVRLLRQPVYRYKGDKAPHERRTFRETMTVWLMGPRN